MKHRFKLAAGFVLLSITAFGSPGKARTYYIADVVRLVQAQMETVDMVPDTPGIWMFRCHLDDHMNAGMATL